jgi:hypothetical protein
MKFLAGSDAWGGVGRFAGVVGIGFGLVACGPEKVAQVPQAAPVPVVVTPVQPVFVATPGLTPRERIKKALTLLGNGEAGQARAELEAFLIDSPTSDLAKGLIDQIDRDPREMLGSQSFAYTLKSGETLSVLADRYLNDRYKFWALAKFNNIANPAGVSVGQSILIPGLPRTIVARTPAQRTDDDEINDRLKREKEAAAKAAKARADAAAAASTPATPPPVVVAASPEKAKSYRKAGLELLRRGSVDLAIKSFNQAMVFAKGTDLVGLISADLQRAQKIKANMKR